MLTDAKVRAAKPRAKVYKLSDANGLFLSIAPNGSKLLCWKYRIAGTEKLLTVGACPDIPTAKAHAMHGKEGVASARLQRE